MENYFEYFQKSNHPCESFYVNVIAYFFIFILGAHLPIGFAQNTETTGSQSKTVQIIRAPERPSIDGRLTEDAWSLADVITDFHEMRPDEYAEPSTPTEIYLLYDDNALYIGAQLWEADPDAVTGQVLRQGELFFNDDHLGVILDPFNTGRSGYLFATNPNGVRISGLYQSASQLQLDWDGIFEVATTRHENGWTFEMEIPFKTLSFSPTSDTWGINFFRTTQSRNDRIAWVSRNRSASPSISGLAVGLTGLQQGTGLDLVPSVSLTKNKSYRASSASSEFDPSLDIFYKFTPALSGSLTFNTDFSATEVDDRQVNLTRFPLFFPEKRTFFLQDLDIFEFGRIENPGFSENNTAVTRPEAENGRPFFSRQIGLSPSGKPVNLDYGGKLTGRVGQWNLGLLSIQQEGFNDIENTDLFVGRVDANVLSESSAGIIVTSGDPKYGTDNTVMGADFRYQNTRLGNGRTLEAEAWYQKSETNGVRGNDSAFGVGIGMPNRNGFRWDIGLKELEKNFKPALGFLIRPEIRSETLQLGYTHRPNGTQMQTIYSGLDAHRITRLAGTLDTETLVWRLIEIESRTRDKIILRQRNQKEILLKPFEISKNIFVPPGHYSNRPYMLTLQASGHRTLSGQLTYFAGPFYGGYRRGFRSSITWRPSQHFRSSFNYNANDFDIPSGKFITRVASLRLEAILSVKLSWANLLQYDNVSETIGINSRLHWTPKAGQNLYLVLNHNLQDLDRDNEFHSSVSELTAKINYTFRF